MVNLQEKSKTSQIAENSIIRAIPSAQDLTKYMEATTAGGHLKVEQFEQDLYLNQIIQKPWGSVLKILGNEGIKIETEHVYAEQRRKIQALETIQELEGIAKHEVVFLDDNVLNVIDVKKFGFNSYWATWGYKAPGHTNLAQVNNVIGLSLEEFLASKFNILQEAT